MFDFQKKGGLVEVIREKRTVVWGTGLLAKLYMDDHPELDVYFFIDSYANRSVFKGRRVLRPELVNEWERYKILILVEKNSTICSYLDNKGLKEGVDYSVIPGKNMNVTQIMEDVAKYKSSHLNDINRLFVVPWFGIRGLEIYRNFLKAYIQREGVGIVFCTNKRYTSCEEISSILECKVLPFPDLSNWDGKMNSIAMGLRSIDDLSSAELSKLEEILGRKEPLDGAREYVKKVYVLLREIIWIIHPSEICVWGGWGYESYILGDIARDNSIKMGYMEHGWIGGTFQIDPCGIIGQGECAVHPDRIRKVFITEEDIENAKKVKEYILRKKLDSGAYRTTVQDEMELVRIDKSRKTVLLVGMNEKDNAANKETGYWNKYISYVYSSMKDMVDHLVSICRKNNFNLVFKPHPYDHTLNMCEYSLNDIIYIEDASMDRLINESDVVVSISSASEYKVLMYDKPLVQVGLTSLSGKGCSYEAKTKEHVEKMLSLALENGMTSEQKENFLAFVARLLKRYLWDDLSERDFRYGISI